MLENISSVYALDCIAMSGIMRLYENDGLTDYSRFNNLCGLSGTCDMYDMD